MDDEPTPDPTPDHPEPVNAPPGAVILGRGDAGHEGPGDERPGDERPGADTPGGGTPGADTSPTADTPRRLRRDVEHGMLGGVAAGVARYLDIDVVIVRVALAVLTVFGGSGILIYAAAWLLIPADDEDHPLAQMWAGRRPPRRSLVVIGLGVVVGLIALSDLFSSGPWWPHRDGGFGFGFGVVALVLALILVVGSGGNRTAVGRLRWLFITVVVVVVAMVVVAAATVFSIEAVSGVPLRGGIGDTQVHPTTAGQLAPTYRLAIGNLNVDLSDVPFRTGTTHVTATVGIGRLSVEVPPGPVVSVVAHSGLGDVQVFGQGDDGFSTVQTMQSGTSGSTRHIVLDVDAGVGQVDVVRSAATFS